jgi:hypothetical protein
MDVNDAIITKISKMNKNNARKEIIKKIFPIFNLKSFGATNKRNVRNIILNHNLMSEMKTALTTEYHKMDACGPINMPNWDKYNQCANNLNISKYNDIIARAKKCVHLRKIMWFLMEEKEYPFNSSGNQGHIKPIKETEEYLKECESFLKKAERRKTTVEIEKLKKTNHDLVTELSKTNELLTKLNTKSPKKEYGKEKHPITGRMVSKCAPDKERNPITGACRKKCNKDKEEINIKDGKCIAKCKDGKVRNPETGRCKSIDARIR